MASGYYDLTAKTLGKGHYGVVKLGRHCLTGEPVAIKIIEKSRLNCESLNQLGSEIRILFRLSEYEHPNILKLYQTIDTEDKLFLVTEYCGPHACDLHDYLLKKHGRDGLCEKEAQIFFVQICSAISYCHSMGIVHRDLKPENILVTDYRHFHSTASSQSTDRGGAKQLLGNIDELQYPLLKLIDFGFANQWYPDEKMRTSCGTLAYSAPELLLGEPYDGTKVDVWGLGLMLYILLYGGNPFMQINDNETLTRILDCSFTTPKRDNVDNHAMELLRSLIKRNPDTRLPIDAILRHKWFSSVAKPFEFSLKYRMNQAELQASNSKQLPKAVPVVSPALPSISESGPLKNLNRSLDDDQELQSLLSLTEKTSSENINVMGTNPSHSRTRSLSITRSHKEPVQQQSLAQTRSSINLGRLIKQSAIINISPLPQQRSKTPHKPLYRPTSPDVCGGSVVLSEEERKIHDRVIQEMFRLTKLIDSRSSIEASLKNARFSHRLFNQNSIQPTQLGRRKLCSSLAKSLFQAKETSATCTTQMVVTANKHHVNIPGDQASNQTDSSKAAGSKDRAGMISSKLSNDDYIYATYQLIRDRILRAKPEQAIGNEVVRSKEIVKQNSIPEEELEAQCCGVEKNGSVDEIVSAKENLRARQRKLLQPQHKMRDKFTSFFRSGSTSPNNSFSIYHEPTQLSSAEGQLGSLGGASGSSSHELIQHEAFSDHNNETNSGAAATGRYFGSKTDSYENAMAYALPLARKCSLVSEESGCSNDNSGGPDSH